MPRPNHNLPNLLIGGVVDYADEENMSKDEAHAELLTIALNEVGILSCSTTSNSEGTGDGGCHPDEG